MTAAHAGSNFLMSKRTNSLGLRDVTAARDGLLVHLLKDTSRERQLLLIDVFLNLPDGTAIIVSCVDRIAKTAHALHGHFHRLVTLSQILGRPRVCTAHSNVFHRKCTVRTLRIGSIALNVADLNSSLALVNHPAHIVKQLLLLAHYFNMLARAWAKGNTFSISLKILCVSARPIEPNTTAQML